MDLLIAFWYLIQGLVCLSLILPFFLYVINFLRVQTEIRVTMSYEEFDYAIIVTAYEQVTLLPSVVDSLLKLNYKNYIVYVVADKCDISNLNFSDSRVVILKPDKVLASNTKSHFYAINRFERLHSHLTIIDSDNLVEPEYLNELNHFFRQDYLAVQGVRSAKNLNTNYACLDEAGDMYYRFIDRKLLFEVGSSASLAGSGMAFRTDFYKDCLERLSIEGAGFDKVLQMEILKRGKRIAFAEKAIVFDEKTSKANQLVNQRARWINTWFRYVGKGVRLTFTGIYKMNWNQFLCGIVFSRPPLFITFFLTGLFILINIFISPWLLYFWLFAVSSFFLIFFIALHHFSATRSIYRALMSIPLFVFFQLVSLLKAKRANNISTATVHYHESTIDEVKRPPSY